MKTTLKSKVSTLDGYSYGEREAGTTLSVSSPLSRANTECLRPGKRSGKGPCHRLHILSWSGNWGTPGSPCH
jgi:hypothetical protein